MKTTVQWSNFIFFLTLFVAYFCKMHPGLISVPRLRLKIDRNLPFFCSLTLSRIYSKKLWVRKWASFSLSLSQKLCVWKFKKRKKKEYSANLRSFPNQNRIDIYTNFYCWKNYCVFVSLNDYKHFKMRLGYISQCIRNVYWDLKANEFRLTRHCKNSQVLFHLEGWVAFSSSIVPNVAV